MAFVFVPDDEVALTVKALLVGKAAFEDDRVFVSGMRMGDGGTARFDLQQLDARAVAVTTQFDAAGR